MQILSRLEKSRNSASRAAVACESRYSYRVAGGLYQRRKINALNQITAAEVYAANQLFATRPDAAPH